MGLLFVLALKTLQSCRQKTAVYFFIGWWTVSRERFDGRNKFDQEVSNITYVIDFHQTSGLSNKK